METLGLDLDLLDIGVLAQGLQEVLHARGGHRLHGIEVELLHLFEEDVLIQICPHGPGGGGGGGGCARMAPPPRGRGPRGRGRAAGARGGGLALLLALLLALPHAGAQGSAGTWNQRGGDIDGEAVGERSGGAVATNGEGDVVAVGAHRNKNSVGENAGRVRVYKLNSGNWEMFGGAVDGAAAHDRAGSSVALSGSLMTGLTLAVGAFRNDGGGQDSGHVRVFTIGAGGGGVWAQLGPDIVGVGVEDRLGVSVSLSSDGRRVIAGAPRHDGEKGHARVYEYSTNIWSSLGSDLDGAASGDLFGAAVAISGDGNTVAVGGYNARNADGDASAGVAKVFRLSSVTLQWEQIGSWEGGQNDELGRSVSLSENGDIVALGAPGKGGKKGYVDVQVKNPTDLTWVRRGDLILGEDQGDRAGEVSISGDGNLVLIGSKHSSGDPNAPASRSGQARLFQYQTGAWQQRGLVNGEAGDDKSGWAVALNANANLAVPTPARCVIGAPFNNGQGADSGHARVYEYNAAIPGLQQVGGDIDGDGDSQIQGDASVSLSNDGATVAIGSSFKDGAGGKSGHVNVYSWSGTKWSLKGVRIDGTATGNRAGKSVALAGTGNTLAVGAFKYKNPADVRVGQVRVLDWSSGAWQQSFNVEGDGAEHQFGYSVSMSSDGSVLAVGATQGGPHGQSSVGSGYVRMFIRAPGVGWTQTNPNQLLPNAVTGIAGAWGVMAVPTPGDAFGSAVAVSGDGQWLAVGAPQGQTFPGYVSIYSFNNAENSWQYHTALYGDGTGDKFGFSVSLSTDGSVLAVGAPGAASGQGKVRTFKSTPTSTHSEVLSAAITGTVASELGRSVSLSGNGEVMAVGAPLDAGGGTLKGQTRVYEWATNEWVLKGSVLNGEGSNDRFGDSVSISQAGNFVAAAAPFNSGNGETSGSVRVFEFQVPPSPSPSPPPPPPPPPPPSSPPPKNDEGGPSNGGDDGIYFPPVPVGGIDTYLPPSPVSTPETETEPKPPEIPDQDFPPETPLPIPPSSAPLPPLPRVSCEEILIRKGRKAELRACRRAGRPDKAARSRNPPFCLPVKKRCLATMHNGGGSTQEICQQFKRKGCRKAGCAWQAQVAGTQRRAACGPRGEPLTDNN